MFYELDGLVPRLAGDNFVAPNAALIGQVVMERGASVWFGCTLRADNDVIHIGANSNVQDGSVLHVDTGVPLHIGANCTIGHQVMLHGCTIGEGSLIGMQSVILNHAVIGKYCVVAAGSVVTEGKQFPDGSLILGAPAKAVRQLTEEDRQRFSANAVHYVANAARYRESLQRLPDDLLGGPCAPGLG